MVESMISLLTTNLVIILACMTLLWLVSLGIKDASIVDSFWGPGFIIVTWSTFAQTQGFIDRNILVSVLVTLWGVRLFLHIYTRNMGKGEDYRYIEMRQKHGSRFPLVSYFTIFLFQGFLMLLIALSVQISQLSPLPDHWTWTDFTGAAVWVTGFYFEAVGDWQLRRFLADQGNRGKVMDRGLWAMTRHPNYFGEAVMWWGIFIIAAPLQYGFVAIISPLLITFLLLRVSGVTLPAGKRDDGKEPLLRPVRGNDQFLCSLVQKAHP